MLAIAGSLARKGTTPVTAATFPTHKPPFVAWSLGSYSIVGGLTFSPAPALGPIVEQLSTQDDRTHGDSATAAAATSAPRLRAGRARCSDPMIVRSALPQSLRKLPAGTGL